MKYEVHKRYQRNSVALQYHSSKITNTPKLSETQNSWFTPLILDSSVSPVSSSIFLFRAPRGPINRRSASLLYFSVAGTPVIEIKNYETTSY